MVISHERDSASDGVGHAHVHRTQMQDHADRGQQIIKVRVALFDRNDICPDRRCLLAAGDNRDTHESFE